MKLLVPPARRIFRRMLVVAFIAGTLGAPSSGRAQDATDERCSAQEYRQFDFWVGEWEVRNPDGDLVGRNTVRRILGGCVLHESWTGTDGSTGESFNIYDARAGAWHQTWVDNSGLLLELNGELAGDAMVLRGELPAPDGGASLQRITWTPADDGSVRQLWERSTDGAASWSTVFDGIYRRVGPEGDDDADG